MPPELCEGSQGLGCSATKRERFSSMRNCIKRTPTWGLLKKKWRLVRDAANEEGVGSTETRLSSDLPIGCLKHANVPKHHPEGP
jgi:hypothetical protein